MRTFTGDDKIATIQISLYKNIVKKLFLLDPEVVYLNHGAFGATPRSVFKVYQKWQRKLEHQPTLFFSSFLTEQLALVRKGLATFVDTNEDSLLLVPNVTFAINMVARSIKLKEGDEILTTDHEYGACNFVWKYVCQRSGAKYIQRFISIQPHSREEIISQFWGGVTERTKLIFISHITSPTAMILPVREICQMARRAGILTFVDGAHAPGQIPLSLRSIDADFYAGNCHKWMLAPKGSAFLDMRLDKQHLLEPLIVSWGWGENDLDRNKLSYVDRFQWIGTRDPSAYLAIPAAIQFQERYQWQRVRFHCHQLLKKAITQINHRTGLHSICPDVDEYHAQMGIVPLPPLYQPEKFKAHLYERYRIEVPITMWHQHRFLRISVQGYNTQQDLQRLFSALEELLPLYTAN